MGRAFWLLVLGLVALAVHITYVLFAPGMLFEQKLYAITEGKVDNSFFILSPEKQSELFPVATTDDVVGVCKYDLGSGSLVLAAKLPKTFWMMSIYTKTGKQVYSLDDVQAGSSDFSIKLSRAKTFFEQIVTSSDADDAGQIENLGWQVETSERRGLAIVWIPLSDPLMRKRVESVVRESKCEPQPIG